MIKKIDHFIHQLTVTLLVLSFLFMLGLSFMSIALRWFGSSQLWVDPFVRHLVLLCAFLGASLATGRGMHIKMDVFSRVIEKWPFTIQKVLKVFMSFMTAVIVAFLFKSTYDFWLMEKEFGGEVFLGLSSGVVVLILPFGFLLIGLRTILVMMVEMTKTDQGVK